jgi:hypothetical protein
VNNPALPEDWWRNANPALRTGYSELDFIRLAFEQPGLREIDFG